MTHLRPYSALALAGCLWGTGFLFGKIALAELTVPHMILYRLMFACGGFLPVALARGFVHRREDWITLSMAAAFGVSCVFLIQFEDLECRSTPNKIGDVPTIIETGFAFTPIEAPSTRDRLQCALRREARDKPCCRSPRGSDTRYNCWRNGKRRPKSRAGSV